MTLQEKVKARRTRPATVEGEEVFIKVHSGPVLKRMLAQIKGGEDDVVAGVLADQFLDGKGQPVFSKEFFLSEDCPQCFFIELAELFITTNTGVKKK